MKSKNKIGPSTDPCGTPEGTVTWEDFSLSKTTPSRLHSQTP